MGYIITKAHRYPSESEVSRQSVLYHLFVYCCLRCPCCVRRRSPPLHIFLTAAAPLCGSAAAGGNPTITRCSAALWGALCASFWDSSELGRDGGRPAGGPLCTAGYGMGCGLYPNALGTAVGGVEAQRSGGAGQHREAPSIWRPVLAAGRWKNGDHDHGVIRYRRTV